MKTLQLLRLVVLALLVVVGSSGFGPRAYTHPGRTAEATQQSATGGQSRTPNQPVPTAPVSGQKPKASEATTLRHTLVESAARGLQTVGEAIAKLVAGAVTGLLKALLSLFVQRSIF